MGVGRPDSTDPDVVAAYVLSRFEQPESDVRDLIGRAADEAERLTARSQPRRLTHRTID